jgi:hypothetical protein
MASKETVMEKPDGQERDRMWLTQVKEASPSLVEPCDIQFALWRVKMSGLAQEMGTPLNVILWRAESLLERTEEETAQAALQSIIRQVEQLIPLRQQLCALDHEPEIKPRVLSAPETLGGRSR